MFDRIIKLHIPTKGDALIVIKNLTWFLMPILLVVKFTKVLLLNKNNIFIIIDLFITFNKSNPFLAFVEIIIPFLTIIYLFDGAS